jgi:glycosyltransferase involved in cell wall biosynthesis
VKARHSLRRDERAKGPNPLRVVIVMPVGERRGGAERLLVTLLEASARAPDVSYQVVFLQPGPLLAQISALGYATYLIPAGRLRSSLRTAATVVRLANLLRRLKPDVALSWMAKGHLYLSPAAFLAGVPAIWWQHTIPRGDLRDVLVTRLPAPVVFCCSAAAAEAQSRLRPRRPTCIIHPGIDVKRLNPEQLPTPLEARRLLGLPGDRPIVAVFARLQRWKGIHLLIEAVASMSPPDRPLAVICGGPHFSEPDYPNELKMQAERLQVSNSILFAGHVEDPALWMQAADVIAQPNLRPEPFGMAIVEGMALAKPVIAAAEGGPIEIITQDGYDGWLIEPGDVQALAATIHRLCRDRELCCRVGRHARERAQAFGREQFAERVRQCIQSVCKDCGRWSRTSI